ncbi:ACP S-malonyltransferase [Rhodothermus profundi]|uniref:Malonyl CoA-acyl carrier protein transacylase n=1 Tax=Rhodothermus profundi TaxID=633813 RepID=A0A1M6R799_9BACT|nr:ACP S-malonyltransferase [Rhodothermus profundi]SHK28323.1 [acyl-carrier-protein] S-malonyltransferase [Rhodothermus profundi]
MAQAWLFPGQGSQRVGMAQDLLERFPEARARLEAADRLLGFSLTAYMFGARAEDPQAATAALAQTDITQPALFVHSLAAVAVLEAAGQRPEAVAGHSLGEYSALAAAGVLSFEDGLRLVRLRGQLMAEAGRKQPGTMAAILGLDDEEVEAVCRDVEAEGGGLVQPANYNAPGQVVISGEVAAVERAAEKARARGARRVVMLPVSGAFHSPLMEEASRRLAEAIAKVPMQAPRCPVYLNVTAAATTDPEEIRARLAEQMLAPVRFTQILHRMQADGITAFLEVGPGNVLTGLVRRTLGRNVQVGTAGTAEELETLLQQTS